MWSVVQLRVEHSDFLDRVTTDMLRHDYTSQAHLQKHFEGYVEMALKQQGFDLALLQAQVAAAAPLAGMNPMMQFMDPAMMAAMIAASTPSPAASTTPSPMPKPAAASSGNTVHAGHSAAAPKTIIAARRPATAADQKDTGMEEDEEEDDLPPLLPV
jgi:hypothetical protein